jgi:hypothetical protein
MTGTENSCEKIYPDKKTEAFQNLLVFQQNNSGESKIKGVRQYGEGLFNLEVISIDTPLPTIIEDSKIYLPRDFAADLVLDFLKHPDLSHDLSRICHEKQIPIVASGKKLRDKWALTPPT